MKTLNRMPAVLVIAYYFLAKIADRILHPLKDIPEPDFNNTYDSTML